MNRRGGWPAANPLACSVPRGSSPHQKRTRPDAARNPLTTMRIPRADILSRLRDQVRQGKPVIGAGAGTGISAKCAEAGGVDLIIIYNSGRYRMAGRGSLAGVLCYGDANEIVVDMAREVLTIVC